MDLAGPKIRTRLLNKGKAKGKLKVKEGEIVWLADDDKSFKEDAIVIRPNEPGIITMLKKGERVYIDDGMIKGRIETTGKNKAAMRIVLISSARQQIKEGKGINFLILKSLFLLSQNLIKYVYRLYVIMLIWWDIHLSAILQIF